MRRPAGGWFDSSRSTMIIRVRHASPLAITFSKEVSQAPHPWSGSPGGGIHGDGYHGGHAYEACRTISTDGGFDVQGMLHPRLSTPGLLRLPVRRVQESQGQAPLARTQPIHLESPSSRTSPCAGEGSAMRLPWRRTRRMRQTPRPVRRPQHHRRPLAARTRRAH